MLDFMMSLPMALATPTITIVCATQRGAIGFVPAGGSMSGRSASALFVLLVCLPAAAGTYKAPRTSDGQPDLQGFWTNATLTPVERSAALGNQLVLSDAEATAMERQFAQRMEAANAPSDPNEVQRAGQAVGGYNMFWADLRPQNGIV